MNIKRIILFSLSMFVVSEVIDVVIQKFVSTQLSGLFLSGFLFAGIFILMAKWYFKKIEPTLSSGIQLGCFSVGLYILYKAILNAVAGIVPAGMLYDFLLSMSQFSMVTWIWFVELVLLGMYAGFEFDGTYSPVSKKSKQ